MPHAFLDVGMTGQGVVSRRAFLQTGAASAAALMGMPWRSAMLAQAAELKKHGKSMILLWMDGGPSQFECFNPKIGSENHGPTKAIDTKLPGVQICELWPETAKVMDKICLIRSMKTREAEHDRAIIHLRTGYPISPTIRYPSWGSVVARERERAEFELPSFVRIGKPRITTRDVDAGVLGVRYAPFKIDTAGELPPNTIPPFDQAVLQRRLALAGKFDGEFARAGGADVVNDKQTVYDRTKQFVLSPRLGRFKLDDESDKLRDAYGRTPFGQGCLLARRLIEEGVSFIEVINTGMKSDQGWDTHKKGFDEQPNLCGETDPAYATLLKDMEERGLLKDTLVVWMGEFGRTPKLKSDGGRDHYAEGWQVGLSGCGVKVGQVIGATDKDGVKVTERPIDVPDLFVTFCKLLNIDPRKEYTTADARPIKLVEGGGVIEEIVG